MFFWIKTRGVKLSFSFTVQITFVKKFQTSNMIKDVDGQADLWPLISLCPQVHSAEQGLNSSTRRRQIESKPRQAPLRRRRSARRRCCPNQVSPCWKGNDNLYSGLERSVLCFPPALLLLTLSLSRSLCWIFQEQLFFFIFVRLCRVFFKTLRTNRHKTFSDTKPREALSSFFRPFFFCSSVKLQVVSRRSANTTQNAKLSSLVP